MEKELNSVLTPEGKMEIVNGFTLREENRKISFALLEDESIIVNIRRFEESEEEPYTKEITNQNLRLSKLTLALLICCIYKADKDFDLDINSVLEEINKNQE